MSENKTHQSLISKIKDLKIVKWFFIISGIVSILWSLYFAREILITPYQIGFREGAPQVLTALFLRGENFFTFEHQPLSYNAYGLGYTAVVLPFAFIFGNTLHIHRWVTFIFVILSTLTGFWIVFQRTKKTSIALIYSAFIMIAFIGWGGIGSAPTTMGTFLFITAIFIPYLRSFDVTGLVISAILALMAFHTKAYFVLSFGIVASYVFLFVSKRKSLIYFLIFFILFAISFIAIRITFPLYFVNVIYGNAANTFRVFKHLYTQLFWLFIYFFPILVLTLSMFWRGKIAISYTNIIGIKYNILKLNYPFLEIKPDYSFYTFIVSFLTFVIVLGSHVGNYLAYSYELVVPTFLFWFFVNFHEKKGFNIFSVVAILLNLFCWQYITLNPQMLVQRNSSEWEKVYSYLEPSMNILNSPTITSKLVELGIQPVDSGQTDVYYLMKPYPDNLLVGPSYDQYLNDGLEYTKSINDAIVNQQYDLIITTKDVDVFYDLDLIPLHYELVNQLVLYMNQTEQKWVVQIWKPLPK